MYFCHVILSNMLTGHIMNSTCLMMPKHGISSMFFDAFSSKKGSWKIHINSCGQSCCIIFPCCYFTGKEKDEETGYGYFGARYMDHELMTMWLSVDPLADKYPNISPYAYCAWNPMKLVDPDGNEAIDNDDWYKDKDGYVHWDANVNSQKDLNNGEEYLGKTVIMTAEGSDEVTYGDQYGHTWESVSLQEVSVTEKAPNPLVDRIHQSAGEFWGNPVTKGVLIGIASLIGASELLGLCSQLGPSSSVEGIALTEHASERAVERGFSKKAIHEIIKKGEMVQRKDRYSGLQKHYTYKNNTVIVNDKGNVVTMYGKGTKNEVINK